MQLSNPAVKDVYGLEAAAIAAGVLDVHTAKRFRSSLEKRTVFIEMHFGKSYGSRCFTTETAVEWEEPGGRYY